MSPFAATARGWKPRATIVKPAGLGPKRRRMNTSNLFWTRLKQKTPVSNNKKAALADGFRLHRLDSNQEHAG